MLTFEEFNDGTFRYNNFYLHFCDSHEIITEVYQGKMHYQIFEIQRPELAKSLCSKITELIRSGKPREVVLKEHGKELYDAYLFMRQFVDSDIELFR